MKRKVLSVMLATAMTATLFAGCGSDASNADSANSADATASTTEAGDAKTDAAASGSGSVYYLNFKPEQDQQWQDLAAKYIDRMLFEPGKKLMKPWLFRDTVASNIIV